MFPRKNSRSKLFDSKMSLEAIKFDRDNYKLSILDQLLLPHATKYIEINTIADAFSAIKKMQVRGAPAIAIVGILSVVVELGHYLKQEFNSNYYYDLSKVSNLKDQIIKRLNYLVLSRPTAVNLSNATNELSGIITNSGSGSFESLFKEILKYSCDLIDDDFKNNVKLGDNGKDWILSALSKEGFEGEFSILTICNTGSLATSGYGTALGVIRSLWKHSSKDEESNKKVKLTTRLSHAYPLETRPYNQGARLTAYELVYEKIPSTLITDSMVTYLISTLNKDPSRPPIKACVVGADRIVKNGDTANKIGTYQLALICKQFGIKFLVVAPKTTIDLKTEHGDQIVVEQRPAHELRNVNGGLIDLETNQIIRDANGFAINGAVGIAPQEIDVFNPSFDVTPHELIDGIVTEDGVSIKDANGQFDLISLFK